MTQSSQGPDRRPDGRNDARRRPGFRRTGAQPRRVAGRRDRSRQGDRLRRHRPDDQRLRHAGLPEEGLRRASIRCLPTEWETDGKTYTFKLRDGVKFHSGNPLTADDVVFSFNRLIAHRPGLRQPLRRPRREGRGGRSDDREIHAEGGLRAVPRLARPPAGRRFQDGHGQQEGRRLRRVRRLRRRVSVGQGRRLGRLHRREPEPAVRNRDGQVPGLLPRLRRQRARPRPLPLRHGGVDRARGAVARRARHLRSLAAARGDQGARRGGRHHALLGGRRHRRIRQAQHQAAAARRRPLPAGADLRLRLRHRR